MSSTVSSLGFLFQKCFFGCSDDEFLVSIFSSGASMKESYSFRSRKQCSEETVEMKAIRSRKILSEAAKAAAG
jgi:hypothetical protein